MAYYRLVSDELIVDVIDDSKAVWIEENIHNYSTFVGQRERAQGILCSDGSHVWHLDGTNAFHDFPGYQTVSMEEIEEAEYESLRTELIANCVIGDPDAEPEPSGAEEGESGPTVAKSAAIIALEEKVAELQESNDILTECILEMSEVVYG